MNTEILLIKMPYKESYYDFYYYLPAGIAYLSQALLSKNILHEVHDMQIEQSVGNLVKKIEMLKPKRIGFSMMTFRYLDNYKLISEIKRKFPHITIIVGGPHASTFKESIFTDCPAVDIVVPLEGEEVVIELCQNKPLKEIDGIFFKEDNKIFQTAPRELIKNFEKFGFPRYEKFDLSKYKQKSIPVISSRGCPYNCIYCPVSTTIGRQWRPREASDIINELEYWANHPEITEIQIVDDNFTLKRERVVKICNHIKAKNLNNKLNISLGNGIRADKVDYELLKLMKECGFKVLAFGVESGSEKILKILKKGEPLIEIEKAIKWACDLDFDVHLFFVLGAPYETEKDVQDSIVLSQKYPVSDIAFYHLIPFPGTELNRFVTEHQCFAFKSPDFLNNASHWVNTPLFSTPELSIEKRKKLYARANLEGKKFTAKIRLKKASKKLCKKTKLPFWFIFALLQILYSFKIHKLAKPVVSQLRKNLFN